MSENTDEYKFKQAYEDRVDFRSFNEKNTGSYNNSRFSLIRELASESSLKETDIRRATSVKELLAVTSPKEDKQTQANISLSSSVVKKNKNSSLKSFLNKNNDDSHEDRVSPLTEEITPIVNSAVAVKKVIEDNNTVGTERAKTRVNETATATSIPDVKKGTKFSSLFKSSVSSEFRGRKTDSLQELYKRLLNN